MMFLSQSVCSILLALSFLVNRAQGIEIIGYRTASQNQAETINREEKPSDEYGQLGKGLYLTDVPPSYSLYANPWHCVVKGNVDKIKDLSKVWIPESYDQITFRGIRPTKLWYEDEEIILEYVESKVSDPKRALRFTYYSEHYNKLKMVIPTDLINDDALGFWARCWETKNELMDYTRGETLDWTSWEITGFSEEI
ncbi:hypothetical protein LZ554_007170 [Drepanopeziza brunnea f. sp. 'monogermtubi']|nr:hypothetical protein LZ554_007170 [Drepanopeziza brunnea f. sp. 'monogermtubi']